MAPLEAVLSEHVDANAIDAEGEIPDEALEAPAEYRRLGGWAGPTHREPYRRVPVHVSYPLSTGDLACHSVAGGGDVDGDAVFVILGGGQ